jgi:hypothetical protein
MKQMIDLCHCEYKQAKQTRLSEEFDSDSDICQTGRTLIVICDVMTRVCNKQKKEKHN